MKAFLRRITRHRRCLSEESTNLVLRTLADAGRQIERAGQLDKKIDQALETIRQLEEEIDQVTGRLDDYDAAWAVIGTAGQIPAAADVSAWRAEVAEVKARLDAQDEAWEAWNAASKRDGS